MQLLGREAWLPTPEDVILQKLTWNRPKDRDDILGVMLANQAVLDQTYLLKWGQELEVESLFQELCLECKEIADE